MVSYNFLQFWVRLQIFIQFFSSPMIDVNSTPLTPTQYMQGRIQEFKFVGAKIKAGKFFFVCKKTLKRGGQEQWLILLIRMLSVITFGVFHCGKVQLKKIIAFKNRTVTIFKINSCSNHESKVITREKPIIQSDYTRKSTEYMYKLTNTVIPKN